jgi:hypothetical protein
VPTRSGRIALGGGIGARGTLQAVADDQFDVLALVTARLEAARIPYMVSGSLAMSYYAQPRMTRDIDIVVDLNEQDVERVASTFSQDFYCDPAAVRRAVNERRTVNLIHLRSLVKVDLIVRKDTEYRRLEFERRQAVDIAGARLSIVTAEDLLLSKLAWAKAGGSELQLRDARNLVASVPTLDWPYLRRWAPTLSVTAFLEGLAS